MRRPRIASSLAALAIGAGGIAVAITVPVAEPAGVDPVRVEGAARAVSLACPPDFEKTMGAMTAGIGGEDSDTLVRSRSIVVGGGDAALGSSDLGSGGVRTFYESGAFPGELTVEQGEEPVLAAATTQRYQELGELAGMALAPCVAPATTQYLVGGSTAASASAQLVLTNVSGSPATVAVTAYTSTGTAGPSVISSTTVDAQSSQTILVEAGVRDPRLAFEITSTGGQVAAHLLLHEVDGISGAGIGSVTAGAEPGTTVVIPGADLTGEHGTVALRVVNPGEERATMSVSSITADGIEEVPGAQEVALSPGTVLDLSMDGLRGDWSALVVESDVPVLAGVRIDLDDDYAWLASSEAGHRSAAVIPDSTSQVTLYADEPTEAAVTFFDHEGGELDTVEVTVDRLASITSPDRASHVVIDADSPVHVGILSVREIGSITGISGLVATPPPSTSGELLIDIVS
ncbi:DUF5719 family protein [Flaviflexus huanghaiensis]|uniref:DUF5719 family protein n=1 Tax=Flaviflexus huanghaiensis TaxID=1111473 RepID=UPI0015FBCFAD|nr:DUF5719 family protein [Flaviflexus huanghaiensis]